MSAGRSQMPLSKRIIILSLAGGVLVVLPVGLGFLLGIVGGMVLGALIWSLFGGLKWLDRAFRYDGSAKGRVVIGPMIIGAFLGSLGGILRTATAGPV